MTFSLLLAMLTLSFVMSISPGPVNILIITSGINHGFKATFSFISGATIGFTLLLVLIALGLSQLFERYPTVFNILEVFGSLFIGYMGYKIASSEGGIYLEKEANYLKFHEGFLLQWLNPKAWIACVSGVSMFSQSSWTLITFVVIYFVVCYASLSFWGVLGQKATKFLITNRRLEILNKGMGSLLIMIALFIIIKEVLRV